MKLSSANLDFMEKAVGLIITQGLFVPVGQADANAMLLIALYMGQDPASHLEMQERLQERGDVVLRIWQNYFNMVMQRNDQDADMISDSVSQLLRRASDESKDNG